MSFSAETFFAPSTSDVEFKSEKNLFIGLICRMDSYKFGHNFSYPNLVDGKEIKGMTAYGTARVGRKTTIIPAGMQMLVKRYLTQRITLDDITQADEFATAHFGRRLFAYEAWCKVVEVYDGYLPLIIRAVPEGTPLKGGLPIYTVTCLDEDLFWMASAFETLILRAIWYPTTVATMDYDIKGYISRMYEVTGADPALLPFALHDFGGRGVTSAEQAEVGGAAHLFNFMGSDTVEGVLTANFYYNEPMAAYSVPATEHSVQCSFGPTRENAIEYLRTQLRQAVPGGIMSIVIDGYDVYREAEILCTDLKDEIIASGAKIVFRPDSGDMQEVIPRLLRMQEMAFGSVTNEKGFRKINTVGIIQGDGIDHLAIKSVIGKLMTMGFSADNVIFGSGGSLLQKVNRDTFKFAQKASALLLEDGTWKGIAKDPITDPGKKSAEGVLTTARSRMTGELSLVRVDKGLNDEFEDIMKLVYHNGRLFNETSLSEIRDRLA